ncbi:MAG: response regulator [Anaerolineales bacterium]|jgi:DNA-binding response OmpR family regulator
MRPLNVFVVDDDRDFAESLADILIGAGHNVELCSDGETAVQIFREREFDITFMDVKLPGKNGVESFLEIRAIRPQARVVMMTAYSVEQLVAQAVEQGALGVLRKPFDIDRMLAMLEDVKPKGVILMADDDPDFVDSLHNLLADRGYRVLVARTGQEALDAVLADGIDILVLDLKLPVLTGLEVYLELKSKDRALPTIIVTGYAAEESEAIDRLRAMSVSGCLIKPFHPQELLDIIRLIEDEKFQTTWFPDRSAGA